MTAHAAVFAVRREAIDLDSLANMPWAPDNPPGYVRWKEEARDKEDQLLLIYGRQHHTWITDHSCKSLMLQVEEHRLRLQGAALHMEGEAMVKALEEQLADMLDDLKFKGVWLIRFYDLGMQASCSIFSCRT
jgi:hypothetical protein